MRQTAFLAIALALTTGATMAASWTEATMRGVPVYSLDAEPGSVVLVCDPDRVHGGASNGSLTVKFPNDASDGRFAILAEDGRQAAFDRMDGRVLEATADPEEWKTLITILAAGGRYALVSAEDALEIEAAGLDGLRC